MSQALNLAVTAFLVLATISFAAQSLARNPGTTSGDDNQIVSAWCVEEDGGVAPTTVTFVKDGQTYHASAYLLLRISPGR